jgi:small-conductance mechanosensitive channel
MVNYFLLTLAGFVIGTGFSGYLAFEMACTNHYWWAASILYVWYRVAVHEIRQVYRYSDTSQAYRKFTMKRGKVNS